MHNIKTEFQDTARERDKVRDLITKMSIGDQRYLDSLKLKHNRTEFLFNDTHKIFKPSFNDNSFDFKKEFAKECYKQGNATPISSMAIQD